MLMPFFAIEFCKTSNFGGCSTKCCTKHQTTFSDQCEIDSRHALVFFGSELFLNFFFNVAKVLSVELNTKHAFSIL